MRAIALAAVVALAAPVAALANSSLYTDLDLGKCREEPPDADAPLKSGVWWCEGPPRGTPSTNVIEVLDDPFTPTELGDAVLAAQSLQHDTDLVFGRKMPSRRTTDVPYHLICRFSRRPGFLSHLRSFEGYDEPEILPSSTRPICPIGADAGQAGF